MLHFRMVVLYFLLLVLVFVSVVYAMQGIRQEFYDSQLVPTISSARQSFEGLTVYRSDKLKELAKEMEQSDLKVYLDALSKHKTGILGVSAKTRERFPDGSRGSDQAQEAIKDFVKQNSEETIPGFLGLLNKGIRDLPAGITQEKYLEIMGKTLTSCMAEMEAWDVCYFKFTFIPLSLVVFPRLAMVYKEAMPQFFGLVDERGKTARVWIKNLEAQVTGSEQVDIYREALQYKKYRQENMDMLLPAISELSDSSERVISTIMVDSGTAYQVLVYKLQIGGNAEPVGYMLIGYALDDSAASKDVAYLMGLRPALEKCQDVRSSAENKRALISEASCARERDLQAGGVTYLTRNPQGTIDLVGSSLPPKDAEDLKRLVVKSKEAGMITEDYLTAMLVDVPVDYVRSGERMMAVLSMESCKAMAWYGSTIETLVLAWIILFIIGSILMLWLLRTYKRPFEEIDAAVHEVISGNTKANIPFEFSESLPRSMAQSIAVMRSVLLGEPLPEELQQSQEWAGQDGSPITDDVSSLAPCFVEEPQVTIERELSVPMEKHINDLYAQYSEFSKLSGDEPEMDLAAFGASIRKTEKKLTEIYSCGGFRFKMEFKDGKMVLIPLCEKK